MLGEAPPAFDLLYWNGDGTNLPAKMAVRIPARPLPGRRLCQGRVPGLRPPGQPGRHQAAASAPSPARPTTSPTGAGSFNGVKQMGSTDKTFILSQSGHIAGIINPPSKDKYGHYTNDAPVAGDPEAWLQGARPSTRAAGGRAGAHWLAEQSGPMITARNPADSLCPGPGTYVRWRQPTASDISPAFPWVSRPQPQVSLHCRKTT